MLKWEQSITRIRREPLERFNESIQTPDYFRDRRVNFSHIAGSDRFFQNIVDRFINWIRRSTGLLPAANQFIR